MELSIAAYFLAAILFGTSLWHLAKPAFFISITPRWVPWPRVVNLLTGTAELSLALGLSWASTRSLAASAAAVLFIAVTPVHVDMLRPGRGKGVSRWALWTRLILQLPLIAWALSLR